MSNIKIGDHVILIDGNRYNITKQGWTGEVVSISTNGWAYISWDQDSLHRYFVQVEHLELSEIGQSPLYKALK